MKLKDKVAIITGGSYGIGYATADKFLGNCELVSQLPIIVVCI